jgi:hypothetical protein
MLIYFIYYFLLDTFLDILHPITNKCINNHPRVFFILLFHHFISCFLLGGWIFNYKPIILLHFISVIFTIIYWFLNKNLCDLTIHVNKICGWDENQSFNDLLNMIGLKQIKSWNEFWHYIIILVGGFISICKLMKK